MVPWLRQKGGLPSTRMLGAEPHTPLDIAVRKTLIGLRCLADELA
jgi:hypothetical protein